MTMIDDIKRDREAGTPGPWKAPYETFDNGWALDTDGENTTVGIGKGGRKYENAPIAITAVESAFGMDHIVDANARRIARVPDLEAALIAAHEALRKIANEPDSDYEGEIRRVDRLATDALDAMENPE